MKRVRQALFIVIFAAGVSGLRAERLRITSQFNPHVIRLGQRSVYQVTVYGAKENLEINLPPVEGLRISPNPSVSQSTQIINFQVSSSVTYSFSVQPARKGEFTIPAWTAEMEGKRYRVPAATLRVAEAGEEFKDAFFLELELPKDFFLAGETVPCALKLYLRPDLQARWLEDSRFPQKTGDGFIQSEITEDPAIRQERLKGRIYKAAVWPVALTAVKAGEQIISYQMDLAVPAEQENRRRRDWFDSFFDDPFFSRGRFERVSVFSGNINIPVRELPREGRPGSFQGAIGVFQLDAKASARETRAGEPITFTMEVFGEGNFGRISPPEIAANDNWKVYPPKTHFEADDKLGYKGTKTFEYILIPQSEEITEIPPVEFSYFEPEKGEYVKLRSAPLPLKVKPAPAGSAAARPRSFQPIAIGEEKARSAQPDLLPIQLVPGARVARMRPVFVRPFFFLAQIIPAVLLCGALFWRHRQLRLRNDPLYARNIRAGRAVRRWLQAARRAAAAGDAPAFFDAARRALQESAGRRLKISQKAETLTWPEVGQFLRGRAMREETVRTARGIFDTCDALKFAPGAAAQTDLKTWEKRLISLLEQLESMR